MPTMEIDHPLRCTEPSDVPHLLSNLPDSLTPPDDRAIGVSPAHRTTEHRKTDPIQVGTVISKIEDIFESIADCIVGEKKELIIQLKTRRKQASTIAGLPGSEGKKPTAEVRKIRFPSKSSKEAWRFAALLRILELSHEALVSGVVTTKRLTIAKIILTSSALSLWDIYYRDPELFTKQAVVDRYVDDIAFTLGVGRDALNVVAAAKGLVAGAFKVTRRDASVADISVEPEGLLVPNAKEIDFVEFLEVQWILVIEKEATFRTLATLQYWKDSLAGKGVIITGKGYPDVQTRQFLHVLSVHQADVPIMILVDFDPDGLGIMSTYKYGSANLAHELDLAVPSIQWLGIRSTDFLLSDHEGEMSGLLKLSARDRRIANKMLEKDIVSVGGLEHEWRRELQMMLMLNLKAEIQILGQCEKLRMWLDAKLLDAVGQYRQRTYV